MYKLRRLYEYTKHYVALLKTPYICFQQLVLCMHKYIYVHVVYNMKSKK